MGNVKVVLGGPRTNRATTAVELVGTSNKSECTRESEMPGACLAVFHTAGAGGETDSTMRRCVPQPSAIAPARYHVSYCAWPAEASFDGHARHNVAVVGALTSAWPKSRILARFFRAQRC